MINDPYQELPPAKRRRTIFRAALRAFLFTTVLVVLYYVLPLDQPLDTGAVARVLIGLAGLRRHYGVADQNHHRCALPGREGSRDAGPDLPFYLLLFASTYFVMERASAASFTQPLTRTDALYFA